MGRKVTKKSLAESFRKSKEEKIVKSSIPYRIRSDGYFYYFYNEYKTKRDLDDIKARIKARFTKYYQKKLNSKGITMTLIKDMVMYNKNISLRSFKQKDNSYRLYCNYENQFVNRW